MHSGHLDRWQYNTVAHCRSSNYCNHGEYIICGPGGCSLLCRWFVRTLIMIWVMQDCDTTVSWCPGWDTVLEDTSWMTSAFLDLKHFVTKSDSWQQSENVHALSIARRQWHRWWSSQENEGYSMGKNRINWKWIEMQDSEIWGSIHTHDLRMPCRQLAKVAVILHCVLSANFRLCSKEELHQYAFQTVSILGIPSVLKCQDVFLESGISASSFHEVQQHLWCSLFRILIIVKIILPLLWQ